MYRYLIVYVCLLISLCEAKLPELTGFDVTKKTSKMMSIHASQKTFTHEFIARLLTSYIENLDPLKTYFIEPDIEQWIKPSNSSLDLIMNQYKENQFTTFEEIDKVFRGAIERRRLIEKKTADAKLPLGVLSSEFKDPEWTKTIEELTNRLLRIRGLQEEAASKLSEKKPNETKRLMQKILNRRAKYENEFLNPEIEERQRLMLSNILKAAATSLDSHTVYFTPEEAADFIDNVQQRLYGIGVELRDDINGFRIVKIMKRGPAFQGQLLKEKDHIIAVNHESIVGMDLEDGVKLIRGEANTPVVLTIIRETIDSNHAKKEEKIDISILRGEIILKELRNKSSHYPFGDGVIGHLKLYSFYQDRKSSSATDIKKAIKKLKKNHKLTGLILDLRNNPGGLISQAVEVAGLFISRGTVVSIKNQSGTIQHMRALDEKVTWKGPLIILVNRASASASEIVAQTLKEYGRVIVVGDDHTFGKGSYQICTLSTDADLRSINPKGEYKVTCGCYYTVSGKSPQGDGVEPNILVPSILSESDIGERFTKFPLKNDRIESNFKEDYSNELPFSPEKIRKLYRSSLQEKLNTYETHLEQLQKNSKTRIQLNKNYQNLLKELKKNREDHLKEEKEEKEENFGQNDLQLEETLALMQDLILLMSEYTPST